MPDTLPNPSCHACGAPIALGEPVALYHLTCDRGPAVAAAVAAQRAALQTIMQILGPTPPASAECCPGCSHEINEALRVLRDVGIEYQPRKGTR